MKTTQPIASNAPKRGKQTAEMMAAARAITETAIKGSEHSFDKRKQARHEHSHQFTNRAMPKDQ